MFKDKMEQIWLDRELCFYTNLISFITIFNINQGVLGNLRIITPLSFDDGYLNLLYTFFKEEKTILFNTIRSSKNIVLYQIINTLFFKISSLFSIDFNEFYNNENYISFLFLGITSNEYKQTPIEKVFGVSMDYKIKHCNIDLLSITEGMLYKFTSMCNEYTKQKLTFPLNGDIHKECNSVSYYIKQRR